MLKHRVVSTKADKVNPNGRIQASEWGSTATDYDTAPTHVFSGGLHRQFWMRDTDANTHGAAWAHPFGAIDVRVYGAVGDGVTDDTVNLRLAITAAGNGGFLFFPSGKTFLVSGRLTPLSNQTWWGYGATLKRAAEVSAATASAITTGQSTNPVVVPDGSLFYVGQDVTVFNGATYEPANHAITAINGNTLSLASAFTVAFPAGGTVISSTVIIGFLESIAATNVSILGFIFDGNKANNDTLVKWENHWEVYGAATSDRTILRDCYVHDAQCEGINVGGVGSTIEHCWVENCNGNGIHCSGTTDARIVGNYVKTCNIKGTAPGHADGCIIFSNLTGDTIITGNYCEAGISGIGSLDSDGNSSVVISDNIIKSCTTYAIEVEAFDVAVGRIIIANNFIYDSGPLTINNTDTTPTTGPYRISVTGNYLSATQIDVRRSYNVTLTDNITVKAGEQTLDAINLYGAKDVLIRGNQIIGWRYGVYMNGAAGQTLDNVQIDSNLLKNQYAGAVRSESYASVINMAVRKNSIHAETGTMVATYIGIYARDGMTVDGNLMYLAAGQYGIFCPQGGASTQGAIVTNNVIRSAGLTGSIKTGGGSQKNLIINNFVQQAIVDTGSPNNTVSGTVTIL